MMINLKEPIKTLEIEVPPITLPSLDILWDNWPEDTTALKQAAIITLALFSTVLVGAVTPMVMASVERLFW